MEQLKYALSDVRRNPVAFFLFFVQMLVVLFLAAQMTVTIADTKAYSAQLKQLGNLEQMYLLRNRTDEAKLDELLQTPGTGEKLYHFYQYLHTSETFRAYSCYDYSIYLGNYQHLPALYVSDEFLEMFQLSIAQGRELDAADFRWSETIPVLLGSSFAGKHQIGEALGADYVVAGFLETGSFYLNPKATNAFLSLDEMAVVPIRFNPQSEQGDLYMALEQTTILTNCPQSLAAIQEKAVEAELFTYHFDSFATQLTAILEEAKQMTQLELTISGLILLFCLLNVVMALLHYLETHRREFAIHLLCGATKGALFARLFWQVAVLLMLCQLIVTIWFRSWLVFGTLSICNLLNCACVLAAPAIRLLHRDVNDILKRSE